MVETVSIPHNELTMENLRHQLGHLMAVLAHSQVLHNPNRGPRAGLHHPKSYGELLAVLGQSTVLLLLLYVEQHLPCPAHIPGSSYPLKNLFPHLLNFSNLRVRLVPRDKKMGPAIQLYEAVSQFLLHSPLLHCTPQFRNTFPLTSLGADYLPYPLPHCRVPVDPTGSEKRTPNRTIRLHRHFQHKSFGFLEFPRTTKRSTMHP
ncbi:unnamed protein product [Spirodela intermedia]|uniref:Uncharacterized protein n=1 Tax=Spirodela intermedia TaxID=51605 RepID=A0A7I8IXT7_SPIIN|nr:unnamed protein product [Spirodela intermedia]CAA6662825.1 unnamed protein product [Spirodela intermedia]